MVLVGAAMDVAAVLDHGRGPVVAMMVMEMVVVVRNCRFPFLLS